MDSEGKILLATGAELLFGIGSSSFGLTAIIDNGLDAGWFGVGMFGVGLYTLVDPCLRAMMDDLYGKPFGITEYLYSLPKRVYGRYKLRRRLKRLMVPKEGEVYV